MPAERIHLIRHGEVHNPERVIYGRLPNFHLSERGKLMAARAAEELKNQQRVITKLVVSPMLRAQQSSVPIANLYGLEAETDSRITEASNIFEGKRISVRRILLQPKVWFHLRNPALPSWGEPYELLATRMLDAIEQAWQQTETGDVALVSHQLPIWTARRKIMGQKLPHDPRNRRCTLSSITSFEFIDGKFVEVQYFDTAALFADALDSQAQV